MDCSKQRRLERQEAWKQENKFLQALGIGFICKYCHEVTPLGSPVVKGEFAGVAASPVCCDDCRRWLWNKRYNKNM